MPDRSKKIEKEIEKRMKLMHEAMREGNREEAIKQYREIMKFYD